MCCVTGFEMIEINFWSSKSLVVFLSTDVWRPFLAVNRTKSSWVLKLGSKFGLCFTTSDEQCFKTFNENIYRKTIQPVIGNKV